MDLLSGTVRDILEKVDVVTRQSGSTLGGSAVVPNGSTQSQRVTVGSGSFNVEEVSASSTVSVVIVRPSSKSSSLD
jgi:hypothetical protein